MSKCRARIFRQRINGRAYRCLGCETHELKGLHCPTMALAKAARIGLVHQGRGSRQAARRALRRVRAMNGDEAALTYG